GADPLGRDPQRFGEELLRVGPLVRGAHVDVAGAVEGAEEVGAAAELLRHRVDLGVERRVMPPRGADAPAGGTGSPPRTRGGGPPGRARRPAPAGPHGAGSPGRSCRRRCVATRPSGGGSGAPAGRSSPRAPA